jgi:asparagine synthetase B (glutamine-hydrolysing)
MSNYWKNGRMTTVPTVLAADRDTVRFNSPIFLNSPDLLAKLDTAEPVTDETRDQNKSRSLFEILISRITKRLDSRPCYVEFSGGCDSSLVLAAAVRACRRIDHDPPIPITYRYPLLPVTHENDYQDAMLSYLNMSATVFEITNEFDLLGPAAQRGLREFGVVWLAPFVASGDVYRSLEPGLFLSGEGGDEVLGPRRIAGMYRAAEAFRRGKFSSVAGNVMATFGPRPIRTRRINRGAAVSPWIAESERVRFAQQVRRVFNPPLLPGSFADYYLQMPTVLLARSQLEAIAAWTGHTFSAPLMDPEFVHAVGDLTPAAQLRNRYRVLRYHFSEQLPPIILNRLSKSYMQSVAINDHAREFARHWDGQIGDSVVDADLLRAHWLQEDQDNVSASTYLLLQSAWLQQA